MCPIETVEPPTEEAKTAARYMEYLFYAQIIVALLLLLVYPSAAIMLLISGFLLYSSYKTIQYCPCVMYIFFSGMGLLSTSISLGIMIQNGILFPLTLTGIATIGLLFFYAIAIFIVFKGYKEFKAIAFEGRQLQPGSRLVDGQGNLGHASIN